MTPSFFVSIPVESSCIVHDSPNFLSYDHICTQTDYRLHAYNQNRMRSFFKSWKRLRKKNLTWLQTDMQKK